MHHRAHISTCTNCTSSFAVKGGPLCSLRTLVRGPIVYFPATRSRTSGFRPPATIHNYVFLFAAENGPLLAQLVNDIRLYQRLTAICTIYNISFLIRE